MESLKVLVAFVCVLGAASAATLGVVQTEGGSVQGQNIPCGTHRSVDVFKGVPFAAKPEQLEKPKPHQGWDGILKATEFAKPCLQASPLGTIMGSEDCLYLNIWVPHGQEVSSNLPVMVWIHGGAFMSGDAMGPNLLGSYLYSGQEIADRGSVVFVSVAYRLGALGFLSTGDSTLPGNYGLWDQHAAIAWVHRNIRSFGGDPENITVFGESAGGASVDHQILSPYNKGLIKRAIAQSGSALCPWALYRKPRKIAEQEVVGGDFALRPGNGDSSWSKNVAVSVGCPTDETMVDCLKSTDAATLFLKSPTLSTGTVDNPTINSLKLLPVVDGDFIPDDPSRLFHNAADIDYLAGINNMDGHSFTAIDIPALANKNQRISEDEVKSLLAAYTREKGQAGFKAAFAEYASEWGSTPSQTTIMKTAVDIGTDSMFLIGAQFSIYLHSTSARSARTYSYMLSEPNLMAGPGKPYHDWLGADHFDDVQYVFGQPFTSWSMYGDRQRELSGYMIAYWTNFAKTGNPNTGDLKVPVSWPEYTKYGQHFLEINAKMNENSIGQEMRKRFLYLWGVTLAGLPSVSEA